MDWQPWSAGGPSGSVPPPSRRWVSHSGHAGALASASASAAGPHRRAGSASRRDPAGGGDALRTTDAPTPSDRLLTLDGSDGEGGGQILRTALTLSLVTGRPFRLVKVRANRDRPGLRPQHLAAVLAAARLGGAEVAGAEVGSSELLFRPAPGETPAGDLEVDIGTAGATALVLQTVHLPIALRAERGVRVTLAGGTFNTQAPSFPYLEATWRAHLAALGAAVALAMPSAGFYPKGGGRLDAWVEPAVLRPKIYAARGRLLRVRGVAGVCRLPSAIAGRLRDRATSRLSAEFPGLPVEIELADWPGASPGAAVRLSAEYEGVDVPATFLALGERGKPAESVADDAVAELLDHDRGGGALDPYAADQVLLPLAMAAGRSEYTVSAVTEHLRTNARTVRAFLDRAILIEEPAGGRPGRVVLG